MRRGELRNATGVNRLPFDYIREVQEAQFRACRQSAREPPGPPEPVISGELRREAPLKLRALPAMQAKLHNFLFGSTNTNNKVCGCTATDDPTRVLGGGGYGSK
jgi:hypothetical protein